MYKVFKYLGVFLAIIYILVGISMFFIDYFQKIFTDFYRIIYACVLILYGTFRVYRYYYKNENLGN